MIHNERKCVHECQEEKSISSPAMEDLDSLVRHPGGKCDPVCFARCCTTDDQS